TSFYVYSIHHQDTPTFPTRRSSDLDVDAGIIFLHEVAFVLLFPYGWHPGNGWMVLVQHFDLERLELGVPRKRASQHQLEPTPVRSEEHTSELQSRENLVCRLLLEKK